MMKELQTCVKLLSYVSVVPLCLFFKVGYGGESNTYARIHVEAGEISGEDSILAVKLPPASLPPGAVFVIKEMESGRILPAQRHPENPQRIDFRLDGPFPAGEDRTYLLKKSDVPPVSHLRQLDDGNGLVLKVSDQEVLRYNYRPYPNKPWEGPSSPPVARERSGNIHPVRSPQGQILSEVFPDGRGHHLGVWGAWVNTRYKDRSYDFWNLQTPDEKELVEFDHWIWKQAEGPVFTGFKAAQSHTLMLDGEKTPVLSETLELRVYPGDEGIFFDYTVEQEWLMDTPLILNAHVYGGVMSWRYPATWESGSGLAVSSEGEVQRLGGDQSADATRARWLKVHGTEAGQTAGFLIMSHPENFRHPEPLRILDDGPAKGGYVHFTPIRNEGWQLNKREHHTYRYRVFVYDGTIAPAKAEQLWQQFAWKPKISVSSH
ncbi:MAG: hypothetical protein EA353_00925 [Puniceicoccaceae bacterium]|nr:MAG: hypothetical protein EA353_00925 [Puniceicoccaceae bacterium]